MMYISFKKNIFLFLHSKVGKLVELPNEMVKFR